MLAYTGVTDALPVPAHLDVLPRVGGVVAAYRVHVSFLEMRPEGRTIVARLDARHESPHGPQYGQILAGKEQVQGHGFHRHGLTGHARRQHQPNGLGRGDVQDVQPHPGLARKANRTLDWIDLGYRGMRGHISLDRAEPLRLGAVRERVDETAVLRVDAAQAPVAATAWKIVSISDDVSA